MTFSKKSKLFMMCKERFFEKPPKAGENNGAESPPV